MGHPGEDSMEETPAVRQQYEKYGAAGADWGASGA
jgi:hypothetical protein